jgi:hypothetical protein
MNKILIDLLLKVQLYYPIGIPQIYQEYPGYNLFKEKVALKIDDLDNNIKTPWSDFFTQVEKKFQQYQTFDESYHQFPSYITTIQLEKSKDSEREITKELVINVSLLTDYYTIFFKDSYKYLRYGTDSLRVPPGLEIIYYENGTEKTYFDFAAELKNMIQQYFPNHLFVEHYLLFNTEVAGGIIYGQGFDIPLLDTRYSIYEFLFSNYINKDRMVILK